MEGEWWREDELVDDRRVLRLVRSSDSMRRKGRYLLPDDEVLSEPLASSLELVSLMRPEGEDV